MSYFPGAKRRGNRYYFAAQKTIAAGSCCSNAATAVHLPSLQPAASHFGRTAESEHVGFTSLLGVILFFCSELQNTAIPEESLLLRTVESEGSGLISLRDPIGFC